MQEKFRSGGHSLQSSRGGADPELPLMRPA